MDSFLCKRWLVRGVSQPMTRFSNHICKQMFRKVICQNIVDDILALSKTRKRGQTHVLKFEDLIRDKRKVVRDVFRYLGDKSWRSH